MMRPQTIAAALAPVAAAVVLAACAAGPDFHAPMAPAADRYSAASIPASSIPAGGIAQDFPPGPAPTRWWTQYGSPILNGWVEEGLAHNRDLQATQASLFAARELLSAQTGSTELPTVNGELEVSRQRALGLPAFGPPTSIYKLFIGVVQVNYDLDLFGGVRRSNEAARADVDVRMHEFAAARQSLVANLVITAIRSAALRREVQSQARIVALAQRRAALTERRYTLGGAAHRDVLAASRDAHAATAALPALQAQWARTRNALAILLGRAPQDAPEDLDFDQLHVPAHLPVAVPSDLVHARPDILAAEASLHAANARLGLATANLYPKLTLTGSYGSESFRRASFLHSASTVWGVSGAVLQPLFEGGALMADRRAASAERDAAARRYDQTVLTAFGNVGDALVALHADAQALAGDIAAEDDAARSFAETAQRHDAGSESILVVLASEQQLLQERLVRLAGADARLVDTAALFLAIGAPDS
jgi:NodT family efflux transporter outer membrane factor (OMF) lipoprotein